ncbi:MAG: YdeI/OmpD-associated family protein [Ignavibacteriales bacterium]
MRSGRWSCWAGCRSGRNPRPRRASTTSYPGRPGSHGVSVQPTSSARVPACQSESRPPAAPRFHWKTSAKKPETRARRVEKAVQMLDEDKKRNRCRQEQASPRYDASVLSTLLTNPHTSHMMIPARTGICTTLSGTLNRPRVSVSQANQIATKLTDAGPAQEGWEMKPPISPSPPWPWAGNRLLQPELTPGIPSGRVAENDTGHTEGTTPQDRAGADRFVFGPGDPAVHSDGCTGES